MNRSTGHRRCLEQRRAPGSTSAPGPARPWDLQGRLQHKPGEALGGVNRVQVVVYPNRIVLRKTPLAPHQARRPADDSWDESLKSQSQSQSHSTIVTARFPDKMPKSDSYCSAIVKPEQVGRGVASAIVDCARSLSTPSCSTRPCRCAPPGRGLASCATIKYPWAKLLGRS